jgi:hypothetical protein
LASQRLKLKAPFPDSNYLEWSWVLDMHFTTNGVVYVVDSTFQNPEAEPTYYQDNQAVCSVITQTIEPSNIRSIRHLPKNGCLIWSGL